MIGRFDTGTEAFLDFARCQRPDGSYYGTSGTCRKGKPVSEADVAKLKKAAKKGNKKAKLAVEVVEGRKTKAQAKKELAKTGVKETKPKAKKDSAKVEPKKEEGTYFPRETKGKVGGKAKRIKDGFGEDPAAFDPSLIQKKIDRVKASKKSAKDKAAMLKVLERRKSQAEQNQKFLSDLEQNLPKGTKLEVSGDGVTMTSKTPGGEKISSTFSPQMGYAFKVNDSFNAGSVQDRKSQVQVALQVRNQYDALVKSLPTGHRVETSAYTEDGNGAMRQKAYERMGFSSGKPGSPIFAVKQADGTMSPGGTGKKASKAWTDQMGDPKALWFAEDDQTKLWMQIVFGIEG